MDHSLSSERDGPDWSSYNAIFGSQFPSVSIAQPTAPAVPTVFLNSEILPMPNPMAETHDLAQPDVQITGDSSNNTGVTLRARPGGSEGAMSPFRHGPPRRSRYSNLNWDEAKAKIRTLYLIENRSLQETMRIMKEAHSFDASKRLYKEKFKAWKWQKNLPGDHARFMVREAEKRKREENKETTFIYRGLQWTKQRAEASASRTKKANPSDEITDVETPKSIQVETPETSRGHRQDSIIDLFPNDRPRSAIEAREGLRSVSPASSVESEGESESDSNDTAEDQPLLLSWNGQSRTTLISMFDAAQSLQRKGDAVTAETLFVQVLEGYENLLSPTHEDTNKVAYALATFYAEHNRMGDADKVLEAVSRKHVERYGVKDRETLQQVLHVVELLNAWNRPADALAYLARSKYLLDISTDRNGTSSRDKGKARRRVKTPKRGGVTPLSLNEIANDIIKDADPTTIRYGLETARAHVAARDGAAVALLVVITRLCQADPKGLVFENLEARSELLKLYQSSGAVLENIGSFQEAWQTASTVWTTYDWDPKCFKSIKMMEACMKLAGVFLKAKFLQEAKDIFRKVEDKATVLYGCEDERTIWVLISIGLLYQNVRGWRDAEAWFQQALAFSYTAYGDNDGITRSLETSLEKQHFSYVSDEGRPFKTIFGVNGICIRPGRLHVE